MSENTMNDKFEKIGNVTLDYTFYPGEDFYCDGDIEDEILDIVKNNTTDKYADIIEEKKNWPVLYHLSALRGNIVEWLPINKNHKVLEIGSGCGAITGTLSKKCGELTCIDLSRKRSLINAYRNRECENVTIKVGNFQDIEPSLDTDYDYICLIGVFEYAAAYINSKSPYTEFLNIIKKHIKKGGRIAIAIENRFGLKYFAGCQEDHLGKYFKGIEDYVEGGVVRTFTRPGLEKIFSECGLSDYSFYYPYPDYKFMHTLYSDDRLPYKGELTTNLRNFDRDRILLFDEKNAFDSIINDGEFPLFSNSYFVLIGEKAEVLYTKYSNDRDEQFSIRTDYVIKDGKPYYRKKALSSKSRPHLDKIREDGEKLSKRFTGSDFEICPAEYKDDECLYFPYMEGTTLENILDEYLDKGEYDKIQEYTKKFNSYLTYNQNADISDMDMIFPNIIIDCNNKWKLIDYEWSENSSIPAADILQRAIYCYRLGSEKRKNITVDKIVSKDILGQYDEEKLNLNETNFQKKVTGNRKSLSQLRDEIHYEVLPLANAIMRYEATQNEKKVQIYPGSESGFSEDTSYFIMPENVNRNRNIIRIELKDEKQLRVDFSMNECMVRIWDSYVMLTSGERLTYPLKKLVSNGINISEDFILFNHKDSNVIYSWKKPQDGILCIEYEICKLTDTIAANVRRK